MEQIKNKITKSFYSKDEQINVFGEANLLPKRKMKKTFPETVFVNVDEAVVSFNPEEGPNFSTFDFYLPNYNIDAFKEFKGDASPEKIGSITSYLNKEEIDQETFQDIMDMHDQTTYDEASYFPEEMIPANTLYLLNIDCSKKLDPSFYLAMLSFVISYKKYKYLYFVSAEKRSHKLNFKNIKKVLPKSAEITSHDEEFNSYFIKLK